MNDRTRRKLDTFTRVDAFGVEHIDDFAANSLGKQLFTEISTIVDRLGSHASFQASGQGTARQGTTTPRPVRTPTTRLSPYRTSTPCRHPNTQARRSSDNRTFG